ncbi:hypothetical protein M8C21_018482 [Ambrosia artemisiifolia]|uniref:SBP-type domain-containing protein n=1 Tax=Ambrosia artemisiifolia TaxID=4212 RepID=A0AAD5CGP4_AMBAR|nr:hypothetical protein M8C21_018482 [Ambrosia artemisiifolia]
MCFQEMDESWSYKYNPVVKGFASDQSLSSDVAFGRNQLCSLPNELNFDTQIFGDINISPLMNNCSEDHESKSRQSGVIDHKLGRIVDRKDARIFGSLSSSSSKRSEQKGVCSSTPFCKVYGCNKNLSKCKQYYKRHKVCEVHSKTSKVIVNGIEQRFCQQCSRFHLLHEFDDGKRSCRKRLAGHNERRRKPHVGPLFERHKRLLPSYNISVEGNMFSEPAETTSSFPNHYNLHSPYQQMQDSKLRWDINLEDKYAHDLQSASNIIDEQFHSTYVSPYSFKTNPRSSNECTRASSSSSASVRSLLSSQSGNNVVRFGIMYYDDQVVGDESCMIDLFQLSS